MKRALPKRVIPQNTLLTLLAFDVCDGEIVFHRGPFAAVECAGVVVAARLLIFSRYCCRNPGFACP